MADSVLVARPPRLVPTPPMRLDDAAAVAATNLEDAAHVAGGHARGIAFPTCEADVAALDLMVDGHASPAYRRRVAAALAIRAGSKELQLVGGHIE